MRLILASKSPRRQQLLKSAGLAFEIRLQSAEEDYPESLSPEEVPVYLAEKKAKAFENNLEEDELLITSDTVVILKEEIIEKPANLQEAKQMLRKLSGQQHSVLTGVCLTTRSDAIRFSERSEVFFKNLSDQEIDYYVEHYPPLDRAGAYGIQDWLGFVGVERVEGCFYNVMGLPVSRLYQTLQAHFPQIIQQLIAKK